MSVSNVLKCLKKLPIAEVTQVLLEYAGQPDSHENIICFVANELENTELLDVLISAGIKIKEPTIKSTKVSNHLKNKHGMFNLRPELIEEISKQESIEKMDYKSLCALLNNLNSLDEFDQIVAYEANILVNRSHLIYHALLNNKHLLLEKLIFKYNLNLNVPHMPNAQYTVLEWVVDENIAFSNETMKVISQCDIKMETWSRHIMVKLISNLMTTHKNMLLEQKKLKETSDSNEIKIELSSTRDELVQTKTKLFDTCTELEQTKTKLSEMTTQSEELKNKLKSIINITF